MIFYLNFGAFSNCFLLMSLEPFTIFDKVWQTSITHSRELIFQLGRFYVD